LLREDESGGRNQGVRPAFAKVERGQAVLFVVRILRGDFGNDDAVRLCLDGGGIFCRSSESRATSLASSTGSTTARLSLSWRWLVPQLQDEEKRTQQEDSMKYLLMIVAALALVGTASATSRSADCCGGGACCLVKAGCCAK